MSSLFNHIFIPIVILLIFSEKLKLDQKKIMILSFFGILPDADVFLFHRASFHNIFILIIPFLILILTKDIKIRKVAGIICFYLGSHLVLDMFNGGIFLLYPFYNNVLFTTIEFRFYDNIFTYVFDYGISKYIMNNGRGESMISSENIGIIVLLIIFILLSIVQNQYKKYSS